MTPLTRQDLLTIADYERQRQAYRQQIIELKKRRRIALGDLITLVFENRETLRFQIQEMIRAEQIFDPDKVQEELDVYNTLLPGEHELSATLFIEITEQERRQELLDAFQHLDRPGSVTLHAGDEYVTGAFEGGHSKEGKISAVHFVRFPIHATFLNNLMQQQQPAKITVRHERYQAETFVPPAMRAEWLHDLGGNS